MDYTKGKTEEMLGETLENNISQLYNDKIVNWSGKTSDTEEYYTEVISKSLVMKMEDENLFEKISQIDREDYKVRSHYGEISIADTNRLEENTAKNLLWTSIGYLGEIIDYQVPLKAIQTDKAGKIDLISFDSDESYPCAYIIELKTGNNNETLLRAILEIHTYYCQLNKQNFLQSFDKYKTSKLQPKDIKKAILLEESTSAYNECSNGNLRSRPNLRTLIEKLDIDIFSFKLNVEKLY